MRYNEAMLKSLSASFQYANGSFEEKIMKKLNKGSCSTIRFGQKCAITLFVLSAICLYAAEPGFSAGVPTQISCIKTKAFRAYLAAKIPGMKVSSSGGIGRNVNTFSDAAGQRSALLLILFGVSNNDTFAIDNGVKALIMPFSYQNDDGTFKCPAAGSKKVEPRDIYGEAMFIGAVGEAALVLKDSPYADTYLPKLLVCKARVKRWFAHIITIKDAVLEIDRNFCNRLAFDALAFESFGVLFNDRELIAIGETFIRETMRMQSEQGYYPDNKGPDTSYNAVTAWKMQVCSLYAGEKLKPLMVNSIARAMAWEIERIDLQTGAVSVDENVRTGKGQEKFLGHVKDVNFQEVAYSLFYWETIGGNAAAGELGGKVIAYALKK